MLLLLSLPGEGSEIRYGRGGSQTAPTIDGSRIAPTSFSYSSAGVAKAGFSYSHWLSTGQPAANEDWTSGTFVLRPTASDIYNSRLSAAWRNAGTRAADIQALLRDELLLSANGKENNWQASWQNHREAALRGLIDGTSDALLGKALEEGRALSWVRRLDVDFRTSLRDRPGSFGIDAILALHESTDDATGLQLRGFFGNDLKGANAGLFYRHATGNSLLGGNVFLDYENIDDGGAFWRWSLGGEWRSPYVELTGNRYIGITEGKRSSDGDYLYTADGTEIELALRVPQAPWLSGVLSYYEWDGEYGDDEDTGLRYGIRVDRNFKGLSFEVEYEDPEEGEGVWGGRIAYSHDFGKGLESAAATEALTFDPRANFFDAVRREYTQRIRNAGNVFTGRIVITRVDGRATLIGTDQTLTLFGTGANFTADLSGEPRQIITTPNSYTVTATALVTAFTQSPSTLGLSVNNWEGELHSELVFVSDSPTMTLVEGEFIVLRNNNGISELVLTNGITLKLTNNALISVATGLTRVTLEVNSGLVSLLLNTGNILSAVVRNGTLMASLAVNSSIAANVESGGEVIVLDSGGMTTSIKPLVGAVINASVVLVTGYTGKAAQITATGGGNIGYSLVVGGGTFTVGAADGLLSLILAQTNSGTLTASVQISDSGTLGVKATPVTVGYTVPVGEALRFSPDKLEVVITTHDNNQALLTALAAGRLSVLNYALASTEPAGFAGNFAVFPAQGIVSLQQALTAPATLSLYMRATENLGSGVSRAATLLLTVAAVGPPAFTAFLDDSNPAVTIGYNGLVARINSMGGSGTHTYTFQSGGNNFVAGADGRISLLVARTTPTALAAVGVANDGHPNTPPVTLSLTLNILNVLGFTPSRLSLRLTTHDSVPTALYTAAVVDSLGSAITYSLLSTAPANFTANINFTPSNRVLSLTATLTTPVDTSIYILATTAAAKATLTLQLEVVNPPAINAALASASVRFLTGETGKVASVTVTGGAGAYAYAVGSGFAVGIDGLLTLTPAQSNAATLTATVVVNDAHANTAPVNLSLTLTLVEPVSFSPDKAAFTLTTHDSVPLTLYQADLQGGLGTPAYALVSTAPSNFGGNVAVNSGGDIILNQLLSSPITASVYVRGQAATFGGTATLLLTVIAVDPPAFAAALDNSAPVLTTGNKGLVAQVNSTGGKGAHTYTIQPVGGNLTVGTDGRITLLTAVATPTTLSATVVSNDGHPNTPPVTLSLTLRIVNALGFAPVENISLTTYGSSVPTALHTAVAINPLGGAITYLLLSTAPANFTANINFTPTNGIVSLTAELTSPLDASVYIRATTPTEKATLVLRLAVIDPPALAATLVNASAFFLTGEIGKVASVTVTGGAGTYTYVVGSGFAVGTDGLLTLTPAQSNAATLTATVVVNDTHANTNPVSVSLTLTLAQPVSFSPTAAAVTLTTHDSVPATLHQADLQGGLGAEAYALVSTAPIGFSVNVSIDSDNGRIILTQTLSPPVTASVYVRGQAATFGGTATLLLTVIAVNPPAFAAALDNSAPVLTTGNKGLVAQVNSTGGKGAHTYTIQPVGGNLTVGTDGRITLLTAAVMQTILSATLVANDGHPNTPPVTLSLTLLIHGVPAFANASAVVLTGYTGAVASIVNAPSGGFTVIFGGDNFTVSTDGELSLTMAITVSSTLTASVLVDDGTQTVTLGYILNVGLCSFFGGCQPFVNYDGAGGGTAGLNTWVSLSVTMAQALIAAGADVNEALTYTINANNYGVDRPLFAVSRYGSFAVASVLLANNADANTVIQYTEDSATFSNVGILFGAFYRAPTNLDVVPLASLFVTHGADVNHKTGFTGLVTPLDIYNFRAGSNTAASGNAHAQAAVLIKGFGAKCFGVCRNGNGDIRLAAVSFVPTAVVVRTTMTGDLYTVQTYSGLGTRFNYRVVSTFPVGFASNYSVLSVDVNSAILNLNSSQDFGQTISVFIEATDNNSTTGKATLRYIQIIPAPSFVSASVTVLFNYTGRVASITNAPPASGFTVVSGNANFTVGTDGALSLTATILVSSTLTASVLVDDGSQSTTLGYTLRVRSTEPSFVNASVAVLFSYTGQVASITNAPPSSGFSVAFGAANFTIGADGVLSLTTTSAVTTTLTASVVIDASPLLPMTLGYTLNVAACSFFIPGCQPFVNFDGARAGGADSVLNHPGRVAWAAINAPLAQSLIAAGANINEVSSADNDTPLLAVARYGNPAVASVLLTAGANVNAVGRYDENASSNSTIMFSNVGVLEYIKLNATNINPLVSLFVDYGVSVNLRVSINDNANLTPLDYFNTRGYTLAASIIESAGAKCAIHCQTGNLRFASVAFSEGVVSVTVADTDTGDIYTVQAASGLGTQLNYQLLSVSPVSLSASFSAVSVDVNSAKLNLYPALGSGRPTALTVYVEATDNNTTTDKATLQIKIVE